MKRWMLMVVTILSIALLVGCGSSEKKGHFMKDEGVASKIMAQLQEKKELKGKDIKVFQTINIVKMDQPDMMMVNLAILQPGTTDKVDSYTYFQGKWSDAEPVVITGDGSMAENIAPLSQIDFTKLPAMYKELEAKAKQIEGGKVDDLLSYHLDIDTGHFYARIKVTGARESYVAEFDEKGNLIDYQKE